MCPSADNRPEALTFLILGQRVQVRCTNAALRRIVIANYGALRTETGEPDLAYDIESSPGAFSLTRRGRPPTTSHHIGALLFDLEKDLTIALQHRRPDLLFLHAAALERGGKAWLLAGDSGSGKSTTAWGLLHHGFRYLSDELSPIDLATLQVHGYPHALCLKQAPPPAYPLPADRVLDLGATLHVPVDALPGAVAVGPCDLGAVIFVRYREHLPAPLLRALGAAEAGARMYATTLNALAHPDHGLDAILRVAQRIPGFALDSTDLRSTCDAIAPLAGATATR